MTDVFVEQPLALPGSANYLILLLQKSAIYKAHVKFIATLAVAVYNKEDLY